MKCLEASSIANQNSCNELRLVTILYSDYMGPGSGRYTAARLLEQALLSMHAHPRRPRKNKYTLKEIQVKTAYKSQALCGTPGSTTRDCPSEIVPAATLI